MRMSRFVCGGLLVSALAWGHAGSGVEPELTATAVVPAVRDPVVSRTELVLLAPGTQVDRTLPPGWTHLVIKSVPRLASGDLDTLPKMATTTATLFRTVLLADVRPVGEGPDRRFVLRRIG